jgi:hypothetical protein
MPLERSFFIMVKLVGSVFSCGITYVETASVEIVLGYILSSFVIVQPTCPIARHDNVIAASSYQKERSPLDQARLDCAQFDGVEIGLKRCNDKIKVNKRTCSRTPTAATLLLNNQKCVNGKVNRENLPDSCRIPTSRPKCLYCHTADSIECIAIHQ